jgi:uncharacterized protein YbgA (DUF1722 family)/uncharacterized protein YbbK (DUF523 family)
MHTSSPIKLGISKCLLGENVRYDGGHKLDRYLRDTLGRYVDFVPVCPEVECGLPIPRESMRLVGTLTDYRLMTSRTDKDITDQMLRWARRRVRELESEGLAGFVFKSGSPSSGMERVKIYDKNGMPSKKGVGLFAREFMARFPLLPVEEEGRLHDAELRENFVEQIFAYRRWQDLLERRKSRGALVEFHTTHKLLLLAHSPKHSREIGKLVAQAKALSIQELYRQYEDLFLTALRTKATRKKHTNVLQHIAGYFKRQLTSDERQELSGLILDYHAGHYPLIVPITLINHYVRKFDESYLAKQYYLNPHPMELQLRNHP